MSTKIPTPAMGGWFTLDREAPRLLGTRCRACGNVFFPREETFCRNPGCVGTEFEEVELGSRGRLWSFTNNCYPPPQPFVAPTDPFQPYAVAAVELEDEKMVVLGQVVAGVGVEDLEAGMEMELVIDTLFEDDEREYLVWKWKTAEPSGREVQA
jgi:uncharacterized OB-fold protein